MGRTWEELGRRKNIIKIYAACWRPVSAWVKVPMRCGGGWGTTQSGSIRMAASAFNGIKKKRLHTRLHRDLNGTEGTCEVGCGWRSGVEDSSPDLGNRHQPQLIKGAGVPLPEIRRTTALASRNLLKPCEDGGLIQMPVLGKGLLGTSCCTTI